ncbi:MAG: right-handed parallel beta-helix repeat-containing protein [Pirellulaceae bacterium]
MESGPTQAVLPLVGLAAEKVIRDQYILERDNSTLRRHPLTSMSPTFWLIIKEPTMLRLSCLLAVSFFLSGPLVAAAADYYVDPKRGDPDNDGSADKPWRSLQEVFDQGLVESRDWSSFPYENDSELAAKNPGAPVKAGDTIWLRGGDYGDVRILGYYNSDFITLAACEGHTPRFHSVRLRSGSRWILKGLHVSPEFGDGKRPRTMIDLESHGWRGPVRDVVVEDCVVRSAEDTSKWSVQQWNARSCSGIEADGTRITVRRNRLKNVDFGITVGASHSLVEQNLVENFAGDGLRGLGNHIVFEDNVVKNCYDVNDNHDDGFQSWSRSEQGVGAGEVVGIILRGNTIINYEDRDQPHRGALQGIGCFDGMYVDWVIENNVVVVDHYHGITLGGARGCRVVNNTVIDPNDRRPGPAAVRVGKHKNGTPSTGCTVRNNLTTALHAQSGRDMTVDHNLIVEDRAAIFVDPANRDFRLKAGSPAIDAGCQDRAPDVDIRGVSRPQGQGVDIGAYEYSAE